MGISWDQNLSVGISMIDLQHQELFRRVNALLEAMSRGKGRGSIATLLGFLKEYVVEHFAAEQEIMRRHGYPGFAAHQREHDGFVTSLLELLALFEKDGPTVTLAIKLNGFVCSWLRQHIATTDRTLGEFMARALSPLARG